MEWTYIDSDGSFDGFGFQLSVTSTASLNKWIWLSLFLPCYSWVGSPVFFVRLELPLNGSQDASTSVWTQTDLFAPTDPCGSTSRSPPLDVRKVSGFCSKEPLVKCLPMITFNPNNTQLYRKFRHALRYFRSDDSRHCLMWSNPGNKNRKEQANPYNYSFAGNYRIVNPGKLI